MARAWHYYPVTVFAILWHAVLVLDYLALRLELAFYTSSFTPDQLAWFQSMPLWMALAWAVAVWSGVLATLLLLVRSGATGSVFALSVLGWIVAGLGLVVLRDPPALAVTGWLGLSMLALSVVVALALFLYARAMHARLRYD